jgi:hypothetical protein
VRLSPDDIERALYCVSELVDRRARAGIPVPEWMRRLGRQLNLASLMSCDGHETCSAGEALDAETLISTTEAAEILGLSTRHVTRLATDLDGENLGGVWVFKRSTVVEYAQERTSGQHCGSVRAASA